MKKKFLALSVLSIFGAVSLASCQGGSNSESSSSASQSESESKSESVAGKINLSTKAPTEIEFGKSLDLEKYVTVTKVDTWSLKAETENIQIDGHTITATDYGDFKVQIIAGSTKKAYSGTIVSADKLAFNEMVTSLSKNYTSKIYYSASVAYDVVGPTYFHNDNYFSAQNVTYPTKYSVKLTDSWNGYLIDSSDDTYSFSYTANEKDGSDPKNLNVAAGLQRPIENYYLGMELSFKATDFEEIYDADGEPLGIYKMVNRDIDDYSTLVGDFGSISCGASVDSDVENYNATFYAEVEDDGVLSFKEVGTDGVDSVELGLKISIFDINKTSVKPVDDWLTSTDESKYKDPYDYYGISELNEEFDVINKAKNYTVESKGLFLNAYTGEKAPDEDATEASEGVNGYLFSFDATTYVTENAYYSHLNNVSDASSDFDKYYNLTNNSVLAITSKDNVLYEASGTYEDGDTSTTWDNKGQATELSKADEGETLTVWDTNLSMSYFTKDNLKKANWNDTSTQGKAWYFNELGEDSGKLVLASMLQIGNEVGSALYSAYTTRFTTNLITYQYNNWSIDDDGTLVFTAYLPFGTVNGNYYYYYLESVFTDIGTTSLDDAKFNLSGIKYDDSTAA